MAMGPETTEIADLGCLSAASGKRVRLFDVPGDSAGGDKGLDYLSPEAVQFLMAVDRIVLLYNDSTESIRLLAQVAHRLGIKFLFARNCCDSDVTQAALDEEPWDVCVKQDRETLIRTTQITDPRVCGISSRNALQAREDAEKAAKDASVVPAQHELFEWEVLRRFVLN
jgi:hypothetical protein